MVSGNTPNKPEAKRDKKPEVRSRRSLGFELVSNY